MSLNETLKNLYYSEKGGYTSPARLLEAAKSAGFPKTTLKQVEQWYSSQPVIGRFRQARHKFPRSVFMTNSKNSQWQIDIAFFPGLKTFNRLMIGALVTIDLFSKKILNIQPTRSKQSKVIAQCLRETIEKYGPPKSIASDFGGEMLGECLKVYDEFKINHIILTDPQTKASPCERVLRYIKKELYIRMAAEGSRNWVSRLESVRKSINSKFHKHLNMSRDQAYMKCNQNRVFKQLSRRETELFVKNAGKFKFELGSVCRIQKQKKPLYKIILWVI